LDLEDDKDDIEIKIGKNYNDDFKEKMPKKLHPKVN